MEGISKRADFYFSYCTLKLLNFDLLWPLLKHVDPGDEQDIREAVPQEVCKVAFVIVDSLLGHLQK